MRGDLRSSQIQFSVLPDGVRMFAWDKGLNVGMYIDLDPTEAIFVATDLLKEIGKIGKPMGR